MDLILPNPRGRVEHLLKVNETCSVLHAVHQSHLSTSTRSPQGRKCDNSSLPDHGEVVLRELAGQRALAERCIIRKGVKMMRRGWAVVATDNMQESCGWKWCWCDVVGYAMDTY